MRCVTTIAMLSLLAVPWAHAQETGAADPAAAPAAEQPATEAPAADAATPAAEAPATTETTAAPAETATPTEAAAPAEAAPAEAAPAEAAPAEAAPAEAAPAAEPVDTSTDMERLIVTGVAGGVALVGLGVGITFGVLALNDYNCLSDVVACNETRDDPIIGDEYLDARAEVERKALYADMGYLVAATAATVAIVGAVEMLLGSGSEVSE